MFFTSDQATDQDDDFLWAFRLGGVSAVAVLCIFIAIWRWCLSSYRAHQGYEDLEAQSSTLNTFFRL